MSGDIRVQAIRAHKRVGEGSCTSIDECYGDEELILALNRADVKSREAAIKWALEEEGLSLEQATNCRWGEDDDPELKALKEWEDGEE